ncbi:MAG: EamA family transporter RarD [Gammaproteobacteria bacterium]|nr:EamA family transporter RarD [Gammaproteobacteria bacterium]
MTFTPNPRRGYLLGLLAYSVWGLFPLYFKTLDGIPAPEVIVHRIIWSALFSVALLMLWRHRGWWQQLYSHPKRFLVLAASGALIACNWLIYVWAVHYDRMVEASLGYYINPLVNVLLAMLFLRERLRRLQWLAIALAAFGVGLQVWSLGQVPWISLALACSFGFYGLIRKQVSVAALPGLAVETWMLVPMALAWLWLNPQAISMQNDFIGSTQMLWLAAAGPVTLLPLLCFNEAAKNLPYASLAFLQYITPTVLLLLAVLLFKEPFAPQSFIFFGFIWAALAVYSWDALRVLRGGSKALPEK